MRTIMYCACTGSTSVERTKEPTTVYSYSYYYMCNANGVGKLAFDTRGYLIFYARVHLLLTSTSRLSILGSDSHQPHKQVFQFSQHRMQPKSIYRINIYVRMGQCSVTSYTWIHAAALLKSHLIAVFSQILDRLSNLNAVPNGCLHS